MRALQQRLDDLEWFVTDVTWLAFSYYPGFSHTAGDFEQTLRAQFARYMTKALAGRDLTELWVSDGSVVARELLDIKAQIIKSTQLIEIFIKDRHPIDVVHIMYGPG